ncbi:hypothetical protein [Paractinoplanes abujensis]|uniref:Uncharacterized protein n=1 Tax=Paractinoplanes abujensis TaxID=882441 RepID=A0A7W7CTP9_9ACTN|nr:hypothetical protein [Actinoplanes abujensis]MBB4694516.1 hypothetical protein [Actinoplanes abujensis]
MTAALQPPPAPAKATWTDADYPVMGWHDCRIHGLSLAEHSADGALPQVRLMIDLDYIVHWADSACWVAPATLVFDGAWGISGEFGPLFEQLEIADIHRVDPPDQHPEPSWHVEGHNFGFHLRARGFRQHLRSAPQLVRGKGLTSDERGGVSFAERSFQAD